MAMRRLAAALSAACVALAAATLWLPPRIPAQDAPLYHFAAQVIRTPARFAGYVAWGVPLSGGGLQLAAGLLLPFAEPTVALKLLLSLSLLALLLATHRLSRLVGGTAPLGFGVAAASFVGWTFAMGFFNFLSAACLALLGASLWLTSRRTPAWIAAAVLLALAGYVHAVATAFIALPVLLALTIHRGLLPCLRGAWPFALPALLFCATLVMGRAGNAEIGGEQVGWVQAPTGDTLRFLPRVVGASYSPLSAVFGGSAWLLALSGLALAIRQARRSGTRATLGEALSITAGGVMLGYLVAPLHLFDFFYVQPRLPFVAMSLGAVPWLGRIPKAQLRRGEAPVLAVLACTLALGVAPARSEGRRIAEEAAKLPQGAVGIAYVHIAKKGPRYASIPYQSVALHTHAYGTLGGGASAFTFPANPYLNPLRRAHPGVLPTGNRWTLLPTTCARDPRCFDPERHAERLASLSLRFDTLLMPFAPQALIDAVRGLGWKALSPHAFSVGKAAIAARLPQALGETGQVVLEAGLRLSGPVGAIRLPTPHAGGRTLSLQPLPAGTIRIRAFVDLDGNGKADAADRPLLPNFQQELRLRPGQRLSLRLSLRGSEERSPAPDPASRTSRTSRNTE